MFRYFIFAATVSLSLTDRVLNGERAGSKSNGSADTNAHAKTLKVRHIDSGVKLRDEVDRDVKNGDAIVEQDTETLQIQTQRAQALAALWRAPEWKDVKTISSCPNCGKKVVYLTFDDGPADTFPEFAAKLHEVGAKATFFWTAGWTKFKTTQDRTTLPEKIQKKKFRTFSVEELKKSMQDGEFTLGSHTWSHSHLSDADEKKLDHEIQDADVLFNSLDLQKGEKIKVFRPPYGEYNSDVINYMKKHNKPYTVVLWDIDTLDWDVNSIHSAEDINRRIDEQWGGDSGGEAGHIILMHEGKNKADNVESISKVVAHIRELCPDCEFQSLDQCPAFVKKGSSQADCPSHE